MPDRVPIPKTPRFGNNTSDRDRLRRRRSTAVGRLYDSRQWRDHTVPYIPGRDPFRKIGVLCGGDAPSTAVDHEVRAEKYVATHRGDLRSSFDSNNLRGAGDASPTHKTHINT